MSSARMNYQKLVEIITLCFDLSMDGGVPEELRPKFLVLGKRLRGTLMNLLAGQFDAQKPKFVEANKKIKKVNRALKKTARDLSNIADTLEQTGKLIEILDDLLGIAVSFV